jgi:molecular chaperone GrpE
MKSHPKKKEENSNLELINGLKLQLQRALADYDNLRKRTEIEKEGWFKYAGVRVVGRLLPILDNLESMQKHLNDQGLAITIIEFKKVLKDEGFNEIKPEVGSDFDENRMEAVEAIDGGEKGKVAELLLPGWLVEDGQVVRHAKVKVYGNGIK